MTVQILQVPRRAKESARVFPEDDCTPGSASSIADVLDDDNHLQREIHEVERKQMDADGIPSDVWSRNLADEMPPSSVHRAARPPLLSSETFYLLPLAVRLGAYVVKEKAQCRDPFFDLRGIDLRPPNPGPYAGVPLGGIGCGSINRGFRGDFRRWNIIPGRYIHKTYHPCQFSVRVKHADGSSPDACVLADGSEALAASRACKEIAGLRHWSWTMEPKCATYHALYPRAWTVYEEPLPGVRLICRQISPVLGSSGEELPPEEMKGEYVESSLPCAVFEWRVENLRDTAAEVSLMLTWEADAGIGDNHEYVPRRNIPFERCEARVLGIEMRGKVRSRKVYSPREDKASSLISAACSKAPDLQYDDPFSYALACSSQEGCEDLDKGCTSVTRCTLFSSASKKLSGGLAASDIWTSFLNDGCLPEEAASPSAPSRKSCVCSSRKPDELSCSALCEHVRVPAHGSRTFKFALSWDVPSVRFGSGKSVNRWYTRFCGSQGDAAPSIAAWALIRHEAWEQRIAGWQTPILKNPELPSFYKHLIFNELYFISDGGALWTDIVIHNAGGASLIPGIGSLQNFGKIDNFLQVVDLTRKPSDHSSTPTPMVDSTTLASQTSAVDVALLGIWKANAAARASGGDSRMVGQFFYLEGQEYLMYNTYDVHFYASWALIMNWPQLQLGIQKDVISVIASEDRTTRVSLAGRALHRRKERGVVPHDVGSPSEEPMRKVNTYNLQDVSRWKDLGPKFVLQVYRDFHFTKDISYLRCAWPTMLDVMGAMEKYDRDADGLIENDGFPDQTYDIWTVTGASAYTGGLWVAALSAAAAAADALLAASPNLEEGDAVSPSSSENLFTHAVLKEECDRYKEWWRRARQAYAEKLWNGDNGYFDYDNSGSDQSDSCMSDQCAGQWWARACGLPPVCDEDDSGAKASSALLSILDLNVYRFGEICAQVHGQSESVQDSKGVLRQCFLAGAVNGMRPRRVKMRDGSFLYGQVDNACLQSREVWTGVSYGLAAAMLLESKYTPTPPTRELLRRGAFDVARGVYRGGWKSFGYWFATPEAWEATGNVRSMGYMRPLSIWAMQWALNECDKDDCPTLMREVPLR